MSHMLTRMFAALLSLMSAGVVSTALAEQARLVLPQTEDSNVSLRLGQKDLASSDPRQILQVFVGPASTCCAGKSPMAGRYAINERVVTFDPAFDLVTGQTYTVRAAKDGSLTEFTLGSDTPAVAPEVRAVYPSGPVIPENTLRFYIHFSAPMQPHQVADFIQLVNAEGVADTAAFMSFKQELWSADRTRLTLLMDPGRIKRGVAQNLAMGHALEAGQTYSIVIADGWPSALGGEGTARFEHSFLVGPALRQLPRTDLWRVTAPQRNTRDALAIRFDRPFDHALLQRALTVISAEGGVIEGDITLNLDQTGWQFVPAEPWRDHRVELVVDARLEDVAGNNFRDLLDHAAGTGLRDIDHQVVSVPLLAAP